MRKEEWRRRGDNFLPLSFLSKWFPFVLRDFFKWDEKVEEKGRAIERMREKERQKGKQGDKVGEAV